MMPLRFAQHFAKSELLLSIPKKLLERLLNMFGWIGSFLRYRANGLPALWLPTHFAIMVGLIASLCWIVHGLAIKTSQFIVNSAVWYGYCGVDAMKKYKKILVGLYLAYSVATDTIIWGGALYLLINGGF